MSGDSPQGKQVVQASVTVAASLADVWSAWTDSARLADWFPERVEGTIAVGETVRFAGDAVGLDQSFDVIEVVPLTRLRLRGATPETAKQKLDVAFKEVDGAGTKVRLQHSGLGSGLEGRDVRDRTAAGWQTAVAVLRVYAEHHFGKARSVKALLVDASVSFDDLHRYYTDAEFLRRWLTADGSVGGIGEACELVLQGGSRVSGEVLSRYPGRNVALACPEMGGVLVFCARSSAQAGKAGRVGVWMCTWEPDNPAVSRLEEGLAAAVERLSGALTTADEN